MPNNNNNAGQVGPIGANWAYNVEENEPPAALVGYQPLGGWFGGVNANAPQQAQAAQMNAADENNLYANYQQILKDVEMAKYGKFKINLDDPTKARSVSQWSDEYLGLASQIKGIQESIRREQAELERGLEAISTQTEVVRDIGSTIRTRMSSLLQAATQIEKMRQNLPLSDSLRSEIARAEGQSAPQQAVQPVPIGAQQVAPGLWQQGQG